ncbi:MAG: hypothetical protein BGP18_05955 [Stenotrophomonas sp. 69-14]|nr:MAG: hypothetical protein BGP18_05955 [Stenotrophomonas sp. 69-14]
MKAGEWAADPAAKGAGRLQARKLQGGQVAFYYRYTAPDGTRPRMPLGTGLTLAEARLQAAELSRRYQAGDRDLRVALDEEHAAAERAKCDAEAARAQAAHATLGALLDAYVQHLKDNGKQSAVSVENAIRLHVKGPFPELWAAAANALQLDDLLPILSRMVRAKKLREAGKIRSYLRAAYSAAIRARQDAASSDDLRALGISANPARDLATIEGGNNARKRALSLAELRAYWQRIEHRTGPRGALLRFHLLSGGQRILQMGRLQVHQLDRDRETVCILDIKGRRKQPREHFVPLLPAALDAIDTMRGACLGPYLVTVCEGIAPAGYDVLRSAIKEVVEEMLEADELPGGRFTPGDIRRTVETRLAAGGQNDEARGQLQSHGLGGVQNRHYNHHRYDAEKRAALDKLYELLTAPSATVTPIAGGRRAG